jgi:hypothetical protein
MAMKDASYLDKVKTRGYDWLPGALPKCANQGFPALPINSYRLWREY